MWPPKCGCRIGVLRAGLCLAIDFRSDPDARRFQHVQCPTASALLRSRPRRPEMQVGLNPIREIITMGRNVELGPQGILREGQAARVKWHSPFTALSSPMPRTP